MYAGDSETPLWYYMVVKSFFDLGGFVKNSVKIWFSGFWPGFDINQNIFTDILSSRYTVEIDDKKPDFLFCSSFSEEHFKYKCVKIYYVGENITPDFNLYDYALGFDRIVFDDRYFRLPLYKLYQRKGDGSPADAAFWENEVARKTKFCNFLYSNNLCASEERIQLLEAIEAYKRVECGGKIRNNIGGRVEDKDSWLRDFKFTIACENSSKPGYVTEKIFEALRAHTIPVYWGDTQIAQDFNPRRFINCHDFTNFEAVVAEIRRLDEDSEACLAMLKEPWFTDGVPPLLQDDTALKDFLYHIIEQGPTASKRAIRDGFTRHYWENRRMAGILRPCIRLGCKLEKFFRHGK